MLCIGNQIISSAIWNKKHEQIFQRQQKIARPQG